MRLPLLLTTLIILTLPAHAQMAIITPEQIGQIFCIGSLGNDMAPVEPLLTPALSAAIADAEARNEMIQKAAPDEKPPLGDGLPWRSWSDYADICEVQAITATDDEARVPIQYRFTQYPDANYTNTLVLKPVQVAPGAPPYWRIDDIDFGEGRTMAGTLKAAFAP
jgi:hypothetical protein